jgi:hypothetical protein
MFLQTRTTAFVDEMNRSGGSVSSCSRRVPFAISSCIYMNNTLL